MKKIRLVEIIVLLIFMTVGCYSTKPTNTPTTIPINLETKNPHIRGKITSIYLVDGKISGISVAGVIEADTIYAKAMVGITSETRVFFKTNREFTDATASDLKEGQIVEVLFTGPIQTSDPVQATALEIAILK